MSHAFGDKAQIKFFKHIKHCVIFRNADIFISANFKDDFLQNFFKFIVKILFDIPREKIIVCEIDDAYFLKQKAIFYACKKLFEICKIVFFVKSFYVDFCLNLWQIIDDFGK